MSGLLMDFTHLEQGEGGEGLYLDLLRLHPIPLPLLLVARLGRLAKTIGEPWDKPGPAGFRRVFGHCTRLPQ